MVAVAVMLVVMLMENTMGGVLIWGLAEKTLMVVVVWFYVDCVDANVGVDCR